MKKPYLKKSKNNKFKKILIIGGSKGIGKSVHRNIKSLSKITIASSSKVLDTSNLESVKNFCKKNRSADVIFLNSGGPPPNPLNKITEEEWLKYFNQLFLGFVIILKKIKIRKNGYIFYLSSSIIKEPDSFLLISSSLRVGFWSLLKSMSREYSKRKISVLNIETVPFKTRRVKNLVKNLKSYEKQLPTGKIGNPDEIGKFVRFVLKNKIKYLTGSTIYFDGNINRGYL